jgi:hypothetical protein
METDENKKTERPVLITVLLILTFIGSGMSAVSFLFVSLSYDEVMRIIEDVYSDFPGVELLLSAKKSYFTIGFFLYSISLMGAILMWKLKKAGFHFYTAAQIFLIILPLVTIPGYRFSLFPVMVTGAFILAYSTNLRQMT